NPETHRIQAGPQWDRRLRKNWSFSEQRSIERARSEHERLVNEFDSILSGIEVALGGTGMQCRRLNDQDLFLLIQQSLNPIFKSSVEHVQSNRITLYESPRSGIANLSIEA